VAHVGGGQHVLQAFERAQLGDAIRRVAAIEPLESDQALLLANRAANLGEHQRQRGPQARVVEPIDQSREMETKLRGTPIWRQSIALHKNASLRVSERIGAPPGTDSDVSKAAVTVQ